MVLDISMFILYNIEAIRVDIQFLILTFLRYLYSPLVVY